MSKITRYNIVHVPLITVGHETPMLLPLSHPPTPKESLNKGLSNSQNLTFTDIWSLVS